MSAMDEARKAAADLTLDELRERVEATRQYALMARSVLNAEPCDCDTCHEGDDQWCCRSCHDLAKES